MPKCGWHRADIIAEVHKRGSSLSRLGREHGLGDSTLRTALHRPRSPSNRIIAAFIGVPMNVLWPDWFDRFGNLVVRSNSATRRRRRRVQSAGKFSLDGRGR